MKIPAVDNPERYAGLYVYDFGTYVSIGYTAMEVRVLRESEAHRSGTAYEIYRVTEEGGFELRGVRDERLTAREAMGFLRADDTAARQDYDILKHAAEVDPVPCAARLELARLYAFDPPNVTALSYSASASTVIAAWLTKAAFRGGDRVICGIEVCSALEASDGVRLDSCDLLALLDYHDRSAREVMRTVRQAVQR